MNNKYLIPYYPLVDFLADFMGNHTEVVLHDFTDLEHSVVKIRNGYISGRKEGDPTTDLAMKKLNRKGNEPYICNYKSRSKEKKLLKSGSFYICDEEGCIVGMLCINSNVENLMAAQEFFNSFLGDIAPKVEKGSADDLSENLGQSINEIIDASISRALAQFGKNSENLTAMEREKAVMIMNEEGVFLLKGAVPKAAAALGIAESSLYRYLKKVKSS